MCKHAHSFPFSLHNNRKYIKRSKKLKDTRINKVQVVRKSLIIKQCDYNLKYLSEMTFQWPCEWQRIPCTWWSVGPATDLLTVLESSLGIGQTSSPDRIIMKKNTNHKCVVQGKVCGFNTVLCYFDSWACGGKEISTTTFRAFMTFELRHIFPVSNFSLPTLPGLE